MDTNTTTSTTTQPEVFLREVLNGQDVVSIHTDDGEEIVVLTRQALDEKLGQEYYFGFDDGQREAEENLTVTPDPGS